MDIFNSVRTTKQICSVDGCDVIVSARGLCLSHYQKQRYRGELDILQISVCIDCETALPLPGKHRCEECRILQKRDSTFRVKKISRQEYMKLWEYQDKKCAACGNSLPLREVKIDHDHQCCPEEKGCRNCIIGLVCNACNSFRTEHWRSNSENHDDYELTYLDRKAQGVSLFDVL